MINWLKNKFGLSRDSASQKQGRYRVQHRPDRIMPYVVVNSLDPDFLIAQFTNVNDANSFAEAYNAQAKRRYNA